MLGLKDNGASCSIAAILDTMIEAHTDMMNISLYQGLYYAVKNSYYFTQNP